MAQESHDQIGRFDKVRLRTVRNVKYISSPIDNPTTDGDWIVAGIIEDDILASKGSVLIRIPIADVLKTVDYNQAMETMYSKLGSMADYGEGKEDTYQS